MPGRFPGRVVEVHRPGVVRADWSVDAAIVDAMVGRGMCELTGADHADEAWKSFFEPDDVVGLKVNPVGQSNRRGIVGAISHPELVILVVTALKRAGVKARNIIVFDRYASEFISAGYEELMRQPPLDGCRWFAASAGYSPGQLAIDGLDGGRDAYSPEFARHVVGYDPDAFVHMGFSAPEHHPKDDRRFRSHLTLIVTKMVNKLITLPVLKDHRSAGVTLSLKNLSHGFNNNVARSHQANIAHGFPDSPGRAVTGPNQCNTFIPLAVNQAATRRVATLHILDGLIGVYEGGPGTWNRTWGVWPHQSLFFATDPVAMDHVGWDIIDAQRTRLGLPKAGDMGPYRYQPEILARARAAALAGAHLMQAATLAAAGEFVHGGSLSEVFDRRQPEHIYLAGTIGLGEFDPNRITHRRVRL
jgi:hypothetical protein